MTTSSRPIRPALSLVVLGALVAGSVLAVTAPASAAEADTVAVISEAVEPVVMGDYRTKDFAAAARELPAELAEALADDVDLKPAEYLAQAAAAADAAGVLESLAAAGVEIAGSHLDGTEFVVNVTSKADAAAVSAAGATPDYSAPVNVDLSGIRAESATDNANDPVLSGGEAIYESKYGFRCSVSFNGYRLKTGTKQVSTAGHCREKKTTSYYFLPQTKASTAFGDFLKPTRTLGKPVPNAFKFGGGYDAGLIAITNPYFTPTASVSIWNGEKGAVDATILVTDRIPAVRGAAICKSGATSGWTCGHVVAVDAKVKVDGSSVVNSIVTDVCVKSGDSGGAALIGNSAVGIVSWGEIGQTCANDLYSGFFPMISSNGSKQTVAKRLGSTWEPAVAISAPVVNAPAAGSTLDYAATISGTVPAGNVRHRITVYIDGKLSKITTKVRSNGTWSTKLIGVPAGNHTYSVRARWGKFSSTKNTAAVAFTVTPPPIIDALSAANPYIAAVALSKQAYPSGARYAYVAVASSKTSVYAAAGAAARRKAPVLLAQKGAIPYAVLKELKRLNVDKIYVAGGPKSLSKKTLKSLKRISVVDTMWNSELDAYTRS
jgi:hypothetical protein